MGVSASRQPGTTMHLIPTKFIYSIPTLVKKKKKKEHALWIPLDALWVLSLLNVLERVIDPSRSVSRQTPSPTPVQRQFNSATLGSLIQLLFPYQIIFTISTAPLPAAKKTPHTKALKHTAHGSKPRVRYSQPSPAIRSIPSSSYTSVPIFNSSITNHHISERISPCAIQLFGYQAS